MKILFITTNNLATNPRIYKEIILAINNGHQIEIISFEFNNWSKLNNDKLLQALGDVNIITLSAGRDPFFKWGWSVFSEKLCRTIERFSLNPTVLAQAVSRRSCQLIRALNRVSKPDLVIGHNPGALWPALVAAKKFKCLAGFDVEDYHPGEGANKNLQNITKRLMVKLLSKFDYVSFASPLILKQVQVDIGYHKAPWFTLLNYFPKKEFQEPSLILNEKVKLVWFSQNIKADRGIEFVLPFLKKNSKNIELHLIGNLDQNFYQKKLKGIPNIIIHPPMLQIDLHHSLAGFDIGLALEPAKDLNNDLAISNKLLAYLQAGLFVVASNTSSQYEFLNEWDQLGICFNYKINNFEVVIEQIIKGISTIRNEKKSRFENFKNNNWEVASMQLLNHWTTKN